MGKIEHGELRWAVVTRTGICCRDWKGRVIEAEMGSRKGRVVTG